MTGDLLGFADTLETGSVVLVLDVPADELPWLALHPAGEWIGDQLRLGKRPIRWCYRPLAWPVWNHEHRQLVQFWSARDGLDSGVIEALRSRRLERLTIVEPSVEQLTEQLREELAVSRRHLREMLATYWDRDGADSTGATTTHPRITSGGPPPPSPRSPMPSMRSSSDRGDASVEDEHDDPSDWAIEDLLRRRPEDRWAALWAAVDEVEQEGEHTTWAGGQQVGTTVVGGVERPTIQMPYTIYSAATSACFRRSTTPGSSCRSTGRAGTASRSTGTASDSTPPPAPTLYA